MNFNINKYKKTKFHDDEVINNKIKALYLWFDYEVNKRDLSFKDQVRLLDKWSARFIKEEFYEIIPLFEDRRYETLKLIVKEKWDNMSYKDKLVVLLIKLKRKINKWLRS